MIRPGIRRLFRLGVRRAEIVDRDVSAEIETHLALRAEQLARQGYSPDAAREEAQRRFGATHISRQRVDAAAGHRERKMQFSERIDAVRHDLVYAARGLKREPLLTTFIVATFALGIGANAAMFGVVDRLLLSGPKHVADPGRVTRLYMTGQLPGRPPFTTGTFGYVTYDALKTSARSFSGVAAYRINTGGATIGHGADATVIDLGAATADLFPLLGTSPYLGRFFTADEDRTSGAEQVVVLGYGFWRRAFGADRNVVGKTMTLSDRVFTIIGVAPQGFTGPELGKVDVWVPMSDQSRGIVPEWWRSWNAQWLEVVARLKPGVSDEAASADATTAFHRAYTGNEDVVRAATLSFKPLRFDEGGNEPAEFAVARWLIGVAAIVLLIACSNVVNLLLARAVRRRREVAVRIALGAGRARVVRLLVSESLMLAVLGGIASVGVAYVTGSLVRRVLLPNVEWVSSPVNPAVLALSAAIAMILGVAVGLIPAFQISRPNLTSALKAGVREGGGHSWRLRGALTVAQAALSVVLLVGAGLFVTSLSKVRAVDLGIQPDSVLVTQIGWPRLPRGSTGEQRSAEIERQKRVYTDALARLRALSGVAHASISVGLPFQNSFTQKLRVDGWDSLPRLKSGRPRISAVTDQYFETVGSRVVRGRSFTDADRAGSELVAIVSETMAATLWPGRDAIGACLYSGAEPAPCSRIVGVARDAHRQALKEEPSMHYYVPFGQERGMGGTTLLVRPSGSSATVTAAVERIVEEIDPTVSIVGVAPLQDSIDPQIRPWRLGATVFGLMGVLALLVAAVGLYSVMSYLVAQRTHELGVRVALGASGANIVQLVIRGGVGMAALGVAIGLALALVLGRFIAPLLFDTSPRDVRVLGGVAVSMLAVALLASWVPAMRARRVNPLTALRSE